VRAVAAAGLLDDAVRARLWRAAQNRPHYLIGWLEHEPQTLPPAAPRELPGTVATAAAGGDPLAALLLRYATAQGQGVLRALALALERPPTHDAVFRVLDVAAALFAPARAAGQGALAEAAPELQAAVSALAGTGRAAAETILSRTTAVGPLMRRHLAPVLQPLQAQLQALRGAA
jgi:hypothetical protein